MKNWIKRILEAIGAIPTTPELEADALTRYDTLAGRLEWLETSGTITHPAGTSEEDSLEITPAELTEYSIVLLDVNALTQNTTIRVYIKIDGTNYSLINSAVFPTDFPTNAKGVPITLYPLSVGWKITLQSAVSEGADKDIPYRYVKRSLV